MTIRRCVTARVLAMILTVMACCLTARAVLPDPWDDYDEIEFMDMDLDENINTPALLPAERQPVRNHMARLAKELLDKGYDVALDRDDEVVVVIIPTDDIFMPNDTLLSPRGLPRLSQLLPYMANPGDFKLVYVVHTDNTGSEDYNYDLSQQRVNSIYEWLLGNVVDDQVIIPFAMGDSQPAEPNTTRAGRKANRRLEMFLVPGPDQILKARAGQL